MTAIALCMLVNAAPAAPAAPAADWTRTWYEKGRGDAFIHYVVFGTVNTKAPLSASKYRAKGIPEGVELVQVKASELGGMVEAFGKLPYVDPKVLAASKAATDAVVIQGTVKDPATLDYLRDVVGLITWLLDNGGVAVLDPQAFIWISPAVWREKFFTSGAPEISNHVGIMISDDWYHTRGMRKFGRPDLSIRKVTKAQHADVIEMFNRFIGLEGRGGWIPEGKEVKVGALSGLFARHGGSVEDPDFNNVHVELAPAAR